MILLGRGKWKVSAAMYIWINGRVLPEEEAVVSVYDHGFMYGMGCFETFRTYGGVPFLLDEHLNRLGEGCADLGIVWQMGSTDIQRIVRELLRKNAPGDAYFRLSVSAGADALGLPADDYANPTTIVYTKALPGTIGPSEAKAKTLQLLKLPRNTPEGTVRLKSFHYMNNILGRRELREYAWSQGAEGLFLTSSGDLAEGIVSNLFFVRDGVCYTPALSTGILPGITRAFVIRMIRAMGVSVEEGAYPLEQLRQADEVFLTNSIQEIVPVTSWYDTEGNVYLIGSGEVGPRTMEWQSRYHNTAYGRGVV